MNLRLPFEPAFELLDYVSVWAYLGKTHGATHLKKSSSTASSLTTSGETDFASLFIFVTLQGHESVMKHAVEEIQFTLSDEGRAEHDA